MRFLGLCLFLVAVSTAYGQNDLPQSPRAVNAGEAYKKAISRAASAYQKDLEAALRSATQEGDVKEIVRINRVLSRLKNQVIEANGPIAKSRETLENTTWTMVRQTDTLKLHFGENYKVSREEKIGAWTMLNPQSVAVFVGPEIFVLKFNETFSSYSVLSAYTEVNTKFTGGSRVTN
ncbi:hypothetical protein [Thalassoglobus sp.]|uniref:hypothetical protein n=1 Tax=Thalassoglobus sp. TaxID=2795869 RepID=UPI003AA8971C